MARKTRSSTIVKPATTVKKARTVFPAVKRDIKAHGEYILNTFKKQMPGETEDEKVSRLTNQQKLLHLVLMKADSSCAYCRDLKICFMKLQEIQIKWSKCKEDERFGSYFYTSEVEHCKVQIWRVIAIAIAMTQNEKTFKEILRDWPDINNKPKETIEAAFANEVTEEGEEEVKENGEEKTKENEQEEESESVPENVD